MAEDEEDIWVAPEAKPPVAESRVAVVVDEPEVAIVRLPKGKRRRIDGEEEEVEVVGSEAEESEVGIIVATSIPVAPRGMQIVGVAPVGPRLMAERVGGVRRGSGVPADLFVKRAYRFVGRSLIGERNGMVGDTYQTRGNYARAPFVNRGGGGRGRGYRPYY